jgi:alpha-1,6-mannosyltransferase
MQRDLSGGRVLRQTLPRGAALAANAALAGLGATVAALTAVTPTLHWQLGGWVLIAAFAGTGAAACAALRLGAHAGERSALVIILAAAAAMRLALVLAEPHLSSDIYRYIWDGRVQAAGINPYRYVPNAAELAALRDAQVWPNINRADYAVTIYPPAAQALFLIVTRVAESVTAMKLGLLLFEAAAVVAMVALLRRQRAPATRVAAYAWHPLPVWEIAGNGHVEAAMMALLLAGLLVHLKGRTLLAGLLATLAGLIKPLALLALPVFWRPWDWRLPLVVLATVLAAYLPYLSVGWGVLGFLPGYIAEQGLVSGSGYKPLWLLVRLTGPLPGAATVYIALAVLILGGLALAAGFRSDRSEGATIRALSWLLIAFLVLSSPAYPWYFLVLVPFLALAPTATAWVLTLGGVLFYDVIGNDGLPSYEVRITLFTLATLAALACDLWRARTVASPQPEIGHER